MRSRVFFVSEAATISWLQDGFQNLAVGFVGQANLSTIQRCPHIDSLL